MSGAVAVMVAASGGVVDLSSFSAFYTGLKAAVGGASVTLTFNTDGTMTAVGVSSLTAGTTPRNWFSPTTPGIGSSYWIKFTDTYSVGAGGSTNGASTFTQLNAARSMAVNSDVVTDTTTYSVQIDIADNSGGTPVLSTKTLTMSAVRT